MYRFAIVAICMCATLCFGAAPSTQPVAKHLDALCDQLKADLGNDRVDRSELGYTSAQGTAGGHTILIVATTLQKPDEPAPTLDRAMRMCGTIARAARKSDFPWTRIWIVLYGLDQRSGDSSKMVLSGLWDRPQLDLVDQPEWSDARLKDLTVDGLRHSLTTGAPSGEKP